MALEIRPVIGNKPRHSVARRFGKGVEPACLGRRHDTGIVLRADGVVGGGDPFQPIARQFGAVDKIQHFRAAAEIKHETLVKAWPGRIRQRAGAAQNRRDLGRVCHLRRHGSGGENRFAAAPQPLLGERHDRNHAFIGLARAHAKAENSMLQQHEPFGCGISVVDFGRLLGQQKSRHDVRHDPDTRPVQVGDALSGIGLVGEAQHRRRMRVVDIFVRQKGVQQRLDRRVRRTWIEQIGALDAHHILVRQRVAFAQFSQRCESDRRQAGRLDIAQVPAAAFDAQHLGGIPEQIGQDRLDRRVAAAVQHQPGIAAEQTRGINAQRQIASDAALAIARLHRRRIAVRPQAAHRSPPECQYGLIA